MQWLKCVAVLGAMTCCAPAAVRSGRATVEWITSSHTCEKGQPIQTAIRMVVDRGWHTYWCNPGEGGMKTTVEWRLPRGWKAGGLCQPVPVRIQTGELPGFGYEGTVCFPVVLTPPASFKGSAKVVARLSWLTCDESGCVPGDAEITLDLAAGPPSPTADAPAVAAAVKKVPKPLPKDVRLVVGELVGELILSIDAWPDSLPVISRYDVLPLTPQVVDAGTRIRFRKSGGTWTVRVPKSEYARSQVKELCLVLADRSGGDSFLLSWRSP